jgi:hypothetical protein
LIFSDVITYPPYVVLIFFNPIYNLNTFIGERVPEAIIIERGLIFYNNLKAKLGSKHFIYISPLKTIFLCFLLNRAN